MTMKLYIMSFDHAHFGEGHLNESGINFDAARLFSALFLESLKINQTDAFMSLARSEAFHLSDAFPYIDETPYLPKPIGYPKHIEDMKDLKLARQQAKKVKGIQFIPWHLLPDYMNQTMDIEHVETTQKTLAKHALITKKGEDPYNVGISAFSHSLYVLANQSELFDQLMTSLQYSGLGGKKSSGYGQFRLAIEKAPEDFINQVNATSAGVRLLLSTSLPGEDELTQAMNDAYFLIKKSSGFAYSESAGELLRKQDLYKFKSGSTFKFNFKGQIADVRPDDFPHPVWNYARSLFFNIS